MRATTKLGLAAGVALCVAMVAVADPPKAKPTFAGTPQPPPIETLEASWMKENDGCRGGVDPKLIAEACPKRDRLENALERRGVCWAYSDERVFPIDYGWHDCAVARPANWHPDPEPAPVTADIPDETVTRAQFDLLQINMFREQVTKLMGTPGVNRSTQGGLGLDQLDTVTWGNPDGSQMILTFRNGLLASKTQFGLP